MIYDVDPLTVPYMQRALGGGQLDKRALEQQMQQFGITPFASGMAASGMSGSGSSMPQLGNLGTGPTAPPLQFPGMLQSKGGPRKGPDPRLVGALYNAVSGTGHSAQDGNGDWVMGPQGFGGGGVGGQGGGIGQAGMAGLRDYAGK